MLRVMASVGVLLGLVACGVDGAPRPPADDRERPEPGISISGTASVGVTGGSVKVTR